MDIYIYILMCVLGIIFFSGGVIFGVIDKEKIVITIFLILLGVLFLSVAAYQSLYVTETACIASGSDIICEEVAHSYEPLAYLWGSIAGFGAFFIIAFIWQYFYLVERGMTA
ncbi:MAG: hypothetical protein ACOC80_00660 [Petrotogales bacterium]